MIEATLAELAKLVGGELSGELGRMIRGATGLCDAGPEQITLIDSAEKAKCLAGSQAAAFVVPRDFPPTDRPHIRVDDVHGAFQRIAEHFKPPRIRKHAGISLSAFLSPACRLGTNVEIHPGATVDDDVEIGEGTTIHAGVHVMAGCKIGPGVTIFPNAVLYEDTVVGPRCIIHANAVLGAYGFGYHLENGRHQRAAQLGNVVLEADVEVGAGTTIDRGTYGSTVIGEGTKIDNLVMIAHNCRIGKHNILCSQVGIAGSTTTGDYVVMAGQVGVRDHVHIGTRATLGAKAGIIGDVPDGAFFIGIPATPDRDQKLKQAVFTKLPEMRKQLKALQAAIGRLEANLAGAGTKAPATKDNRRDVA